MVIAFTFNLFKSLKIAVVIPIPPAEFSAFTITKSILASCLNLGKFSFNFLTPFSPTKSPTANIFIISPSFFLL